MPDARIDDDDEGAQGGASVGEAALDDWDLEEADIWRATARDWYAKGIAETPGTGRLHHHLGLLARPHDDLRALYHFVRALTASHPYTSAKESLLPLFDSVEQARRTRPEVGVSELFVHLHGMAFTRIGLDDFENQMERFQERLAVDETLITPAQWIMMAVINIGALMCFADAGNALRRVMADTAPTPATEAPAKIMLRPAALRPEATASPERSPPAQSTPLPLESSEDASLQDLSRRYQELTFRILAFVLRHNHPHPYSTTLMTFVYHVCRQPSALLLIERYIPWRLLGPKLLFPHFRRCHGNCHFSGQ